MDAQWMSLEPLIEACRPKGKTPPQDLRRTISAIVWAQQGRGRLPGLDLRQSQPRGAALGSAQGVARDCDPL